MTSNYNIIAGILIDNRGEAISSLIGIHNYTLLRIQLKMWD